MSWDIMIEDFPADVQSVAAIPHDYRAGQLGTRDEVIARIQQALPEVDFSDRSWGVLNHPEFSIEFDMGSDEICHGFMLHVHDGGGAIAVIARLLQHLRLRGIDCQTGDFFSPEAAQADLGQGQASRDRATSQERPSDDQPSPAV